MMPPLPRWYSGAYRGSSLGIKMRILPEPKRQPGSAAEVEHARQVQCTLLDLAQRRDLAL